MKTPRTVSGSHQSMKYSKFYLSFFLLALFVMIATTASATSNVTLNKPVTMNGLFGELRTGSPWNPTQPLGTAGTINDGIFFAEGTLWNEGSIWWDATVQGSENNSIVIDLQGAYHISGIITQADNNDEYQIEFFNPSTNAWQGGFWPAIDGYGLMTRPNGDQITQTPVSFDASQIRLSAYGGDAYYSYGEFQAFGTPVVPEPSTIILLGVGIGGLALWRRKKSA